MLAENAGTAPSPRRADFVWVHLLRDFIWGGDAKRLGPHASMVLLAIKTHADHRTGEAFPSATRLSELTGVSRREVIRSLGRLTEAGYLARQADGRRMRYRVQERVGGSDAVITWPYSPSQQGALIEQIKAALAAKTLPAPDARGVIHIEQIAINVAVQVVQAGGMGIQVVTSANSTSLQKALRYLDAADFPTRRRWHKRAAELGAPKDAPCAREAVSVWGPFVASEVANEHGF